MMKRNLYELSGNDRSLILAAYLVEERTTVRAAAAHFGISKSTVHKDVTQHVKRVNHPLYLQVKEILETNKRERHLRGGEATRNKYRNERLLGMRK